MKSKFKRLVGMILALSMMLTLLPTAAFAASPTTPTDSVADDGTYQYAYTLNADGTATITDFLGPVDSSTTNAPYVVTVPTELGGYKVTGIGEAAFAGCVSYTHVKSDELVDLCENIETVTIPDGITTIGESAFDNCSGLKTLSIKASVISIGPAAFARCNALETLTFSDNISEISIGDYAFNNCTSLKDFTFPSNVTAIGRNAFWKCDSLEHVTIPGSVKAMGREVFANCAVLTSVTLEEGITSISDFAFSSCPKLNSVKLPESLTSLGTSAFYACTLLNHVTIPNQVTSIGSSVFSYCTSLSDISLNDNLSAIGSEAFSSCSSLQKIDLPSNLREIGDGAFALCSSLSEITLPDSVQTIGERAFSGCTSLSYLKIPDSVTTLKYRVLADDTGLKVLILPANIKIETFALTNAWIGLKAYDPNTQTFSPYGAIYYEGNKEGVDAFVANSNSELNYRKILYLCHVTFDPNGGTLTGDADVPVYVTEKVTDTRANDLTSISEPVRAGYKFTGWYTEDNQPFNFNETAIEDDITLRAEWEADPNAVVYHQLTVTGGTFAVKKGDTDVTDTLKVSTDKTTGKQTCFVPDGSVVTVTLDKTAVPESMVFDIWSTGKFDLPLGQDYKAETITFTMSSDVDVAAQYHDASIDDDGSSIIGDIAIGATVAAGGAVLGYQAYQLGAGFLGDLWGLPYFPSNRSALALMLWEDAGKPMPESDLLYPDVGQEEQDMDLQHAARWAMENELIPDKNDEGTTPEEMKFFPNNTVSKYSVLKAWKKAQELKKNA